MTDSLPAPAVGSRGLEDGPVQELPEHETIENHICRHAVPGAQGGYPGASLHEAIGDYLYRAHGDWTRALEEFRFALEGLPNDAGLWENIGYAHRRLGNWQAVLEAFDKALNLDPRNVNAMRDLGALSLEQMRRYPEAVEWCGRALSLAPDYAFADVHRGRIWTSWTGQLDSLGAALDRHPPEADWGGAGGPGPWRALTLLWGRELDSLLALASRSPPVFENQIFFIPSSLYAAWAQHLMGDAPASQEAFRSAVTFLDSAVAILPDDWRLHASRGMALAGLGQKDEARAEARWLESSRIYKDDAAWGPRLWEDRARVLAAIGDFDAALEEIERLLAGPSFLSVHTLQLDPRWDPLRDDPHFQALLVKYANPEGRG